MECNGAEWAEMIGGVVGRAVGQTVDLVERGSGPVSPMRQDTFGMNGGDERCGALYWWPVAVERNGERGGRLICEMRVVEFENSAMNAADSFEISGSDGGKVLADVADQLIELGAAGLDVPQIFFGTWHTHPRGSTEISAQDFTGEFEFEKWREGIGNFALGNPRSFVFAMGDGGRVKTIVAYDKVGLVSEWTRQN